MTPDRLDELLERALETGELPADASAEERAALVPLLARAGDLKLNAARVQAEASAAMPAARARFQRHLAAEQAAAPAPARAPVVASRGFFDRALGGRTMAFASSAAALAVVAVLAIVILQPFSDPETASALEVDDYVQLEAVVSEASEDSVIVQAPDIGDLEVALSEETAVTGADGAPADRLERGDAVLISGVVTSKRAISATNVAVAQARQQLPGDDARKLPLLEELRPALEGTISLLSLSPDGRQGRVVLFVAGGRLLVRVAPDSMDQFLSAENGGVGSRVRVVSGGDLPKGVFRLEVLERQTPPEGQARPQFQNVRGVVIGRDLNVLQVRTARGVIAVVLRPLTSIRFGDSGLTPADIRAGETVIGYEVALSGNPEGTDSRRVIASIIVVLGKAPARPATP